MDNLSSLNYHDDHLSFPDSECDNGDGREALGVAGVAGKQHECDQVVIAQSICVYYIAVHWKLTVSFTS